MIPCFYLLGKLRSLDFDEGRRHCFHVSSRIVERDSSRPNWILVLVRIDTGINNSAEEIIEDVAESLGGEHPVQSSDKDSLLRIQPHERALNKVRVGHDPRDDLDVLVPHASRGDLEIPAASVTVVVSTGIQQSLDLKS